MLIIYQAILPVTLIYFIGFIGQKVFKLDIKSVSTTALYLMLPALIFRTFYDTGISKNYLYILAYVIFLSYAIILLMKVLARIKRYDKSVTSGLILSTAFMNNGNLGVPLILFAFGEKAFNYAVPIMVFHTLIMSTVGVYYAAKGKADIRDSLLAVFKMPIVYALIIALVLQYWGVVIPKNIYDVVDILADASIVVIMLVLGMQLAEIKIKNPQWGKIALATATRLLVSPLIATLFILLVPVEPLLGKVMVVGAAMPSAAVTTMYALKFDSQPELVTSINLVSTLTSMLTLSALLILI
ncbi:MAG: AEC family transporter [Clostridiales bacterium]|nr:AEC family transporter [Clostridiales bacterium]MCF8023793.1 AEC family transporter [Clostridiales bacterium]